MRGKILRLLRFVEKELADGRRARRTHGHAAEVRKEIAEAARWLRRNLNYIIADAEYDKRS